MEGAKTLFRRYRIITRSIPFVLSALAVLFLTAMPWTPPARPDRDLGFTNGRRASVVSRCGRQGLGRFGANLEGSWDSNDWAGGVLSFLPRSLGLVPPNLAGSALTTWAPFFPSFAFADLSSSRGPPTA